MTLIRYRKKRVGRIKRYKLKDVKKFKRAIAMVGALALLMLFSVMDSVDKNLVPLLDGTFFAAVFVSFFGLTVKVYNELNGAEKQCGKKLIVERAVKRVA